MKKVYIVMTVTDKGDDDDVFLCAVSCMIWEPNSVHKVDLTVMDIGWTIIQRVDKMNETLDYLILGIIFSLLLMIAPVIYRGYHSKDQLENLNYLEVDDLYEAAKIGFGQNWRQDILTMLFLSDA